MNQIEKFKCIHYKIREYLDKKDYDGLAEYLEPFNQDDVDINELKTILIITQFSFLEQTSVSPIKEKLSSRFETLFKELNSKI